MGSPALAKQATRRSGRMPLRGAPAPAYAPLSAALFTAATRRARVCVRRTRWSSRLASLGSSRARRSATSSVRAPSSAARLAASRACERTSPFLSSAAERPRTHKWRRCLSADRCHCFTPHRVARAALLGQVVEGVRTHGTTSSRRDFNTRAARELGVAAQGGAHGPFPHSLDNCLTGSDRHLAKLASPG